MLAIERVIATIEQATGPVCETCLPLVAIVGPEEARTYCQALLEQRAVVRSSANCSICGARGSVYLPAGQNETASRTEPKANTDSGCDGEIAARLGRMEMQLRSLAVWARTGKEPKATPPVAPQQVPAERTTSPVYLGDNLALCWVRDRYKFYVDTSDWYITPHLLLGGYWEMHITNLFTKVIRPGNVVVDLGANFGYFTVIAADCVGPRGQVYAIEAGPRNFSILQRNIMINGFYERVKAFHNAALNERKEVELCELPDNLGGHCVFVPGRDSTAYKRVAVQGVPVDDLIPQGNVDVIKMDVEGCEALVFQGMTKLLERSRNIKILMEWAPAMISKEGIQPADFLSMIRQQGFDISLINGQSGLDRVSDSQLFESTIEMLYLSRPLG